jgi:hypothetical protein
VADLPVDSLAEPDDLRASLEAQFAALQESTSDAEVSGGGDRSGSADRESAAISDVKAPAAHEGSAEANEGRARDEYGRFIPKDAAKDGAAPEKAAPVTDPKVSPAKDETTKASAPAAQAAQDAPPAGWPADAKAEWSKLSPALKAAVAKREQEISEGGRQWSEQRRRYEQVLTPVAQEAQRLGMSVDQGLNALLAAHHALNRDPAGALRNLAQQYGVDLSTLAGHQPANGSSETVQTQQQPDIRALVHQAVQPILAPLQQRFMDEDRRAQESSTSFVTQFAQSPGHEHFDAVTDEIMAMIPALKAANPGMSRDQVLQEAYDRAVYANPTTRAAVLASQQAQADEKRRAEARAHANKARTAASSVTGARSGETAIEPADSLRAEIMRAMNGG